MKRAVWLLAALIVVVADGRQARAGFLYVCDAGDNKVLTVSANGNVQTFASSGGSNPVDVVFDSLGNLYVSNFLSNTIVKFSSSGQNLGVFANTGAGSGPGGMAFDSQGNLYVSNFSNDTIEKYNSNGQGTVFATGLMGPNGLAFDSQGNLYVSNQAGGTIEKITPTGQERVFASGLNGPDGLAFDAEGDLYVANFGGGTVEKFSSTGTLEFSVTTGGGPGGLAVDSQGNLYVSLQFANEIEEFNSQGQSLGVVASTGLNQPAQMSFGPSAVPEPSSLTLLGFGAATLAGGWCCRRCRARFALEHRA